MARVAYNRPFSQVGFRPTRRLTPFHAAHMSGLGYMGDDSSMLASLGFSADQIQQIIAMHADGRLSDGGYQALMSGFISTDQLSGFLDADPGAPTTTAAAASSSPAGVPTGANITYQGIWITSNRDKDANSILQKVSQGLPANGLAVVSMSVVNQPSFITYALTTDMPITVQLVLRVTGPGFAQAQDIASIVDHLAYSVTGNMPETSGATISALPGQAGSGVTPPNTETFTQWLEGNATWLVLGLAAIFVLPSLARRLS